MTPFKGRAIDLSKPVSVYRNLKYGRDVVLYSVVQNGRVVAHTTSICLQNVTFVVHPGGRDRVRATGQKNVHAFVRGHVAEFELHSADGHLRGVSWRSVRYNPFKYDTFWCDGNPVFSGDRAWLDEGGVWVKKSLDAR